MTKRLCCLLAVALTMACPGVGDHEYGPTQDAEAMQRVLGVWSTSDGSTVLTLCEDVEKADETAAMQGGCNYDHVVRPGRGEDRVVADQGGVGCGGCPFALTAFVRGELQHASLVEPVQIWAEVDLGRAEQSDPYALPYLLSLSTVDRKWEFHGEIDQQGDLRLSQSYGPELLQGEFDLRLGGAAACPDPEAIR